MCFFIELIIQNYNAKQYFLYYVHYSSKFDNLAVNKSQTYLYVT